ncbi:MAG: VanW family protein, partial [Pyrinomonadaceae bacterium]
MSNYAFMTPSIPIAVERRTPTRLEAANFRFKTFLLQLKRSADDLRLRSRTQKFEKGNTLLGSPVIAESRTPLWTESEPEERILVAGKIHNLRLAIR